MGGRGDGEKHRRPRRFAPPPHRPTVSSSGDLVYGRRPVWEVLQSGRRGVHKLWAVHGAGGGIVEQILAVARERGVPVEWADRARLDRLTMRGHHQGVAVQVSSASYVALSDFLSALGPTAPAVLVALDEIQDPQNVGAILRSAGFFGVQAAVVTQWRSAPVGETAWRVSSGAVEHVPIIRVTNLVQAIDELKESGFDVWGADMAGEPLGSQEAPQRAVIIMGSEGKGLRRLVREHCTRLVGIPARTPVGSLNVGSSTAIFLYELFRRPR
ncbi:MAG TPA: 23S rRNA (guanosine(2251)-2'-O)-methyltransferase RlmB [Elusimicrobiota bacterium]|nr:23S rRNA (guanosine(2251)-2'-O)-methyltransferase RlmB [Elusimicrobiota bacterium]